MSVEKGVMILCQFDEDDCRGGVFLMVLIC